MSDEKNKIKVEFAPGCFDNFEGSQEELDSFIAEIIRMAESGELTDNSRLLTDENIDDLPEDVVEWLNSILEETPEDNENERKNKLN